jgi:16S rRNA (adenine1518-N6/adenine1519-N6)-dimethyltransferase
MTLSRAEVGRLLRDHGVTPSRALGQNFVADPNTVRRVARLAGTGPGDRVVEVGAGLGSLTLALAETGAEVVAVERDGRLARALREVLAERAVRASVVEADAMSLDWGSLLAPAGAWALVANLPYNIATPLVAGLLDDVQAVTKMLVMVQKEVAERLAAAPGSPAYGAISVKVAYWAEAAVVGEVPASVFVPRPRVASALVRLQRRPAPAFPPEEAPPGALFALVRAGFAQRRKMLRRSLAVAELPAGAWDEAGVSQEARAEQLSLTEWGRLAAAWARAHPELAFTEPRPQLCHVGPPSPFRSRA